MLHRKHTVWARVYTSVCVCVCMCVLACPHMFSGLWHVWEIHLPYPIIRAHWSQLDCLLCIIDFLVNSQFGSIWLICKEKHCDCQTCRILAALQLGGARNFGDYRRRGAGMRPGVPDQLTLPIWQNLFLLFFATSNYSLRNMELKRCLDDQMFWDTRLEY